MKRKIGSWWIEHEYNILLGLHYLNLAAMIFFIINKAWEYVIISGMLIYFINKVISTKYWWKKG